MQLPVPDKQHEQCFHGRKTQMGRGRSCRTVCTDCQKKKNPYLPYLQNFRLKLETHIFFYLAKFTFSRQLCKIPGQMPLVCSKSSFSEFNQGQIQGKPQNICLSGSMVDVKIFYLFTLYIEQHIKTYNNIQYTNGIQKKVFRLIRICIPFKISFSSFYGIMVDHGLFLCLPVANFAFTVLTQIRPDIMLGLILIQIVRHSDSVPEFFFEKVNFEKKSADEKIKS